MRREKGKLMTATTSALRFSKQAEPEDDYCEIARELQTQAEQEAAFMRQLGFALVYGCNCDADEAEKLLERAIDLLFEDGMFQTWRYRQILAAIRGEELPGGDVEIPF